jgi:hypothetical protein
MAPESVFCSQSALAGALSTEGKACAQEYA